jgi:hypothetical protein
VRIGQGISQRRIELVDLVRAQSMFAAIRFAVQAREREQGFVGKISLPEAMGTDHPQRPAFAIGREVKVLTARLHQALAFEAAGKGHQLLVGQPQDTGERLEGRATTLMLQSKKMFERIFCAVVVLARTTAAP